MTPNRHIFLLRRDLFDAAGSYAIWWGGFFVVSGIMSFREPSHAKRVAQAVGLGLPAALIGYFVVTPDSANLWSLSLISGLSWGCRPRLSAHILESFQRPSPNSRREKE